VAFEPLVTPTLILVQADLALLVLKQRSTRHLENATRSIVWTDAPAGAFG